MNERGTDGSAGMAFNKTRIGIFIAFLLAVWLVVEFLLTPIIDGLGRPSSSQAEALFRSAISEGSEVHRADGSVTKLRDGQIATIRSIDCRSSSQFKTDWPLFDCVVRFADPAGVEYLAVFGAMHMPNAPELTYGRDYVLHPWAISNQRDVLVSRGLLAA